MSFTLSFTLVFHVEFSRFSIVVLGDKKIRLISSSSTKLHTRMYEIRSLLIAMLEVLYGRNWNYFLWTLFPIARHVLILPATSQSLKSAIALPQAFNNCNFDGYSAAAKEKSYCSDWSINSSAFIRVLLIKVQWIIW